MDSKAGVTALFFESSDPHGNMTDSDSIFLRDNSSFVYNPSLCFRDIYYFGCFPIYLRSVPSSLDDYNNIESDLEHMRYCDDALSETNFSMQLQFVLNESLKAGDQHSHSPYNSVSNTDVHSNSNSTCLVNTLHPAETYACVHV